MTSCQSIRGGACGSVAEYLNGSTIPQLMDDVARAMRENPDAVREANAVYQLTVYDVGTWTVDTTVPNGRIIDGPTASPDCTFELSEDTLKRMMDRSLSPERAVLTGQLRVSNIPAAMRLAEIIRRAVRD